MKRRGFLIFALFLNIGFVFLHIYKYSCWAQETYHKQQQEKEKNRLLRKKETLSRELCMLKDPTYVKRYAMNKLGMQKIRLNQIKRLSVNNEPIEESRV